ncbi:MAG TPA: isochorismatase family protein [Bryobacteraceae bacterium]|nr:isochorismatase family protein [Bryobacteraceae bacterium]
MRLLTYLTTSAVVLLVAVPGALRDATLDLPLRSRVEAFRGSAEWAEVTLRKQLPIARTALILCDLWDDHWCKAAADRTALLAAKAAPVVDLARDAGMLVIHAPSSTLDFYRDYPQRRRVFDIPRTEPPAARDLTDPPLPIDDSDGGCDTPNNPLPVNFAAWKRQHAAIRIAGNDLISDNGREVYSALKQRGIEHLLVAGVHTNMCVLNRSFAIRQMTRWGVRCILVRDLTDAMYNPMRRPFVTHERGTQLVIEHIEKYWAPTVLSPDLVKALKAAQRQRS